MKTKLFLLTLMSLFVFSSCEKEEPSADVAGTYSGYTSTSFLYSPLPMYADNQSASIANEGTTVSVSLNSETWGNFTATNVTVAKENETYTLTGKGIVSMQGMGGVSKDYDFDFTGTTNTSKTDFEFKFVVPAVMGGTTLILQDGVAPVAE